MTTDTREKRVFHTLDGLRGVAALFVAMRHTGLFHRLGIHGGYLAVDLFFVLSGFVIAYAYERRLASGLSVGRFMAARYLRLWPVYALGAALGLIAALMHALPGRDNLTPLQVAQTAPFALALLPGPHIKASLYPVNSVAWSLALELLVNLAYAYAWRPLRKPVVLAGAIAASAVALIVSTVWFGKLDVGFTWDDAGGGIPRVLFSFTAGLAIYRVREMGVRLPRLSAWAPLLLLPVLLWIKIDPVVYPLVCVLGLFPLMVMTALETRPSGGSVRLFAALGLVSYPLYALHKPVGEIFTQLLRRAWPHVTSYGAWVGVPYLAVLALACLAVERYYDRPARASLGPVMNRGLALMGRLRRRAPKAAGVMATERP